MVPVSTFRSTLRSRIVNTSAMCCARRAANCRLHPPVLMVASRSGSTATIVAHGGDGGASWRDCAVRRYCGETGLTRSLAHMSRPCCGSLIGHCRSQKADRRVYPAGLATLRLRRWRAHARACTRRERCRHHFGFGVARSGDSSFGRRCNSSSAKSSRTKPTNALTRGFRRCAGR